MSLLDTGTGLSLGNSSLLLVDWRSYVKPVWALPLKTAPEQAVLVQGVISLHVFIENLHARTWLGIVENFAVDLLLGTSFIDRCIHGTLSTEGKIGRIHSRAVEILKSFSKVESLLEKDVQDDTFLYGLGNLRVFPCRPARPKMVQPYTQAWITVPSPAAELSSIEPCSNLVGKDQSMIPQVMMDIFSEPPVEVYVGNLLAKPILFTKISSSHTHLRLRIILCTIDGKAKS